MEARIDVHLLTLNEPAEWREACIASLVNNNLELIHPSAPHQLKTDPLGLVPAPFWLGCFELASAVGQLLRLKRILPSGGHSAKVTGDVNLTG